MSTLHLGTWWTWHSDWLNLSLWNILGCTRANRVWCLGIGNVKETTRSHWSLNHRLQFTSIQRQRFQFWLIDGNIDKWRSPVFDLSVATLSTYCVAPAAFTHILLRGNSSDRQVLLFVKSFCLLLFWSESDWVPCPASVMTHHDQITNQVVHCTESVLQILMHEICPCNFFTSRQQLAALQKCAPSLITVLSVD